ncbi:hypothetical protein [Caballeronia sp. LZ035]|uniref:hypothetical protein n=1 Tax=Caballeronia sp. LZ035 TaxID=3038568 RepID=UPI0028619DA4|nr:hypothetical protein [Caballeronia sp. LZ035]MDR5759097.1 hypothetical protein [Caballeronia sp. LZ035]
MRRDHGECLQPSLRAIDGFDAPTESRSFGALPDIAPAFRRIVASLAILFVAAYACHCLARALSPGLLSAVDAFLVVATFLTILEALRIPAWRFVGSWIWLLAALVILRTLLRYKAAPPA